MNRSLQQQIENLVEELRSTGYHGQEQSLAQLSSRLGTLIAAFRQLEVSAVQIASVWLDGEMDNLETWQFIRSSFLPRILALGEIIERSFATTDLESALFIGWQGTRRLIERMQNDESDVSDCGPFVVSLLVAAMGLRQLADGKAAKLLEPQASQFASSRELE